MPGVAGTNVSSGKEQRTDDDGPGRGAQGCGGGTAALQSNCHLVENWL